MYLDHNKIGDEGVTAIANVLKNTNVQYLDLRNNEFGDGGGIALANALKDSNLKTLHLACDLSSAVQELIENSAKQSNIIELRMVNKTWIFKRTRS